MALSVVKLLRPAAHPPTCFKFCTYKLTKITMHFYSPYNQGERCLVHYLRLVAIWHHTGAAGRAHALAITGRIAQAPAASRACPPSQPQKSGIPPPFPSVFLWFEAFRGTYSTLSTFSRNNEVNRCAVRRERASRTLSHLSHRLALTALALASH